MPDIWTHYFFAKEVRLENKLKDINDVAYYLGSQGPDIFYYIYCSPEKNKQDENSLGSIFHTEKPHAMLQFVNEKLEESDEILRSYLWGFLAHYALDSETMPLIMFETNDPGKQKKLLANLDVQFHNERRGRNILAERSHRLFAFDDGLPETIVSFYVQLGSKILGITLQTELIQKAYRDFIRVLKLTRAGGGIRRHVKRSYFYIVNKELDNYIYPQTVDRSVLTNEFYTDFLKYYDKARNLFNQLLTNKDLCSIRNFSGELYFKEECR